MEDQEYLEEHYVKIQIMFDREAPIYNEALRRAGYNERIVYMEPGRRRRQRKPRDILWFNPPLTLVLRRM